MRKRRSPHYYRRQLDLWRESQKSAKSWCQENDLSYQTFLNWKKRFETTEKPFKESAAFLELPDPQTNALELEISGIKIHLERNFDPTILANCLKVLRAL